jgi:hypothetical protein
MFHFLIVAGICMYHGFEENSDTCPFLREKNLCDTCQTHIGNRHVETRDTASPQFSPRLKSVGCLLFFLFCFWGEVVYCLPSSSGFMYINYSDPTIVFHSSIPLWPSPAAVTWHYSNRGWTRRQAKLSLILILNSDTVARHQNRK